MWRVPGSVRRPRGAGASTTVIFRGGATCEAVEAIQAPIDTMTLYWEPGCFYFHKSWVRFIFWSFGLNELILGNSEYS